MVWLRAALAVTALAICSERLQALRRVPRCVGAGGSLTLCLQTGGGYSPRFQLPHYYVYGLARPVFAPTSRRVPLISRPPAYGPSLPYGYRFNGFGGVPQPLPFALRPYPAVLAPYPVVPAHYPVVPGQYPVIPSPYPVAPGPYLTRPRPFYPGVTSAGTHFPGRLDIRTFYQSAVMVGRGVVNHHANRVELICDFTVNGPYPSSDILTDVVWQKVGETVYLNAPMTSGHVYPNSLYCPNHYITTVPANYGFNIVGTRTSLVIRNSVPSDHGVYRCYATRVNRLNPRDRSPVYMEIHFTAGSDRPRLAG